MTPIIALVVLLGANPSEFPHTFRYVAAADHRVVYLAGSFNNWQVGATPMERNGRVWSKTLYLEPGRYGYKFVLDGQTWITDPNSERDEDDGNGNINSILTIRPPDYATPARRGNGQITRSALRHETEVPDLNYDRGTLTVTLRARPDDFQEVRVAVRGRTARPMTEVGRDDLYARYRAIVDWDRRGDLVYRFEIRDGGTTWRLGPRGLNQGEDWFRVSARDFQPFRVPEWVERSVLYQIFPDRFDNADPTNDPENLTPWDGRPTYFNRFGGDLAGIRRRLGHLESLGVAGVYFNPVFQSPSNHRYEKSSYFLIDRELGTNEEFYALTREMERRGIRTILDGVFNHTAVDFPAFLDIRQRGEASVYRDWFFIREFPVEVRQNPPYEAWYGFPSMPKVNLEHPAAKEFMLSIPGWWHERAAIHGWRLDVANEVPMSFWRSFRKTVKALDEDKWIVGEVWGDGSPWLKGDQWDSVMNYRFREAVLQFVASGSATPTQFAERLMGVYTDYAPQVSRNMMNLLGSHDTPRFRTLCGGDAQLAKLGAKIQFAWVGAPIVYYGDELGMEGGPDPDNRRGMRWDLATDQNAFLQLYRSLGQLRRASRTLQSGDPVILLADDSAGTVAFGRVFEGRASVTVVNRSERERTVLVPLGALPSAARDFRDGLSGERLTASGRTLRVSVPARDARILVPPQEFTTLTQRNDP